MSVRIGGASGAWGDSPTAVGQLLRETVDYLVMDLLAEVTMGLLARRPSEAGRWVPDAVTVLAPHLPALVERGVRVVTNAGALDPVGCARALAAASDRTSRPLRVAAVVGDDITTYDVTLEPLGPGAPSGATRLGANAYLGASGIAAALTEGADVVVTGRCADSALALGILVHEHGWSWEDHDLLAAGSLVGHVLECGPQATGGIATGWESVPGWADIGYPVATCHPDGTFELSKPAGTGGVVDSRWVREQVLYEIADPARYILPDVVADFSGVRVEPAGRDRVRASGARGRAPTPTYKVTETFQDGYRSTTHIVLVGPRARAKAERTAAALVERSDRILSEQGFAPLRGHGYAVLGGAPDDPDDWVADEALLRVVLDHDHRDALELVAREVGSIGLSFAPGTAGLLGGRPAARPLVRVRSSLVGKDACPVELVVDDVRSAVPVTARTEPLEHAPRPSEPFGDQVDRVDGTGDDWVEVPLGRIAHARSGDKGDDVNVAVLARHPRLLPVLREQLTVDRVEEHFAWTGVRDVRRYDAPGLDAVNFVLEGALAGGGLESPRFDAQGKGFGQRVLGLRVRVPRGVFDHVGGVD